MSFNLRIRHLFDRSHPPEEMVDSFRCRLGCLFLTITGRFLLFTEDLPDLQLGDGNRPPDSEPSAHSPEFSPWSWVQLPSSLSSGRHCPFL